MSLTAHQLAYRLLSGPDVEVRVWGEEMDIDAPTVTFEEVTIETHRVRDPSDRRRRRDVEVAVLS